MSLKIGNKGDISHEIMIYEQSQTIENKEIDTYFKNEISLKEDEKFALGTILLSEGNKYKNIVIAKMKSYSDLPDIIEDLVIGLGSAVKRFEKDFFLDIDKTDIDENIVKLMAELFAVNFYSFKKYKSKDKEIKYSLTVKSKYLDENFGKFIENISIVRDLVNEPSNGLNPEIFEKFTSELLKLNKNISIEVIKGIQLEKMGMNGIYAVGKGSVVEPRLIIINYKGNSSDETDFGLVGKGITFDTGGYNIKLTGFVEDMNQDMGGAAVVLGTVSYLSSIGYEKNIVAAIPLAENLIAGNAYKPGDVITHYNGKTSEVSNTDAEGRLVLSDSLSYIEEKFSPKYIFDIATLTGAQLIATGSKIAAIMGNNNELNQKIQKISWDIKERVWELPLFIPYFKSMKSEIADMKNAAVGKYGPGSITAGLFLSQFVENKNWVHFDIAGPATTFTGPDDLSGPLASGFGFRLFVKLLKTLT